MTAAVRSDVSGPLEARLVPVLALLTAFVTASAPLAFHWVGAAELREGAAQSANEIAALIAAEAEERPVLWRYDTIRLLEHARTYAAQPHVGRVEVVDAEGRLLDPAASREAGDLLWERAPIVARDATVGHVWVGMSPGALRARSAVLLGVFALIGVALALVVHSIVMRSARTAESRIDALVDRLARTRSEQHLLALGARAVSAQEEERRAIARDLHDSIGQALTSIRVQAEVLATRTVDETTERGARKIAQASDATIEEVRRAIARLGPAVLDELGLGAAIARLLEDLEETGVSIEARIEPISEMSAAVERTAYRIAQEALTNVARHAAASRVAITIERRGEELSLEVRDDGRGITPDELESSHGLRAMRERAEILGGSLSIEALPEGGTRLLATLPLAAPPRGDRSAVSPR